MTGINILSSFMVTMRGMAVRQIKDKCKRQVYHISSILIYIYKNIHCYFDFWLFVRLANISVAAFFLRVHGIICATGELKKWWITLWYNPFFGRHISTVYLSLIVCFWLPAPDFNRGSLALQLVSGRGIVTILILNYK